MVLVDADRVEPALGGEFELVHEIVVHVMGAPRVEKRGVDVHPHRRVLVPKIVRQLGVGHQVKPHQFHGPFSATTVLIEDRRLTFRRARVKLEPNAW